MALKIEGTIEVNGKTYEAYAFRRSEDDELWYYDGTVNKGSTVCEYPILREVKPPHQYKVGDWVRVIGLTETKDCNRDHPIGSVRQVRGVRNTCIEVDGVWVLQKKNIEPCDPPAPKYRPFANAEEFKPHRDRWLFNQPTT